MASEVQSSGVAARQEFRRAQRCRMTVSTRPAASSRPNSAHSAIGVGWDVVLSAWGGPAMAWKGAPGHCSTGQRVDPPLFCSSTYICTPTFGNQYPPHGTLLAKGSAVGHLQMGGVIGSLYGQARPLGGRAEDPLRSSTMVLKWSPWMSPWMCPVGAQGVPVGHGPTRPCRFCNVAWGHRLSVIFSRKLYSTCKHRI